MACSGQIESHVALVMEARDRMRESDDLQLARSQRLHLLSQAHNLVRGAIKVVGEQQPLRALLHECAEKFLEVCEHA